MLPETALNFTLQVQVLKDAIRVGDQQGEAVIVWSLKFGHDIRSKELWGSLSQPHFCSRCPIRCGQHGIFREAARWNHCQSYRRAAGRGLGVGRVFRQPPQRE